MKMTISREERPKILANIQADIDGGMRVIEATKKSGISDKTYYNWLRDTSKPKTKTKKPYVEHLDVADNTPAPQLVCLIGSSTDIAAAIKQWQR